MSSPGPNIAVDPLEYFSWWVFAGAAAFYTLISFTGILQSVGAKVLTKNNAKPKSEVLSVHFGFLILLAVLLWSAHLLYSYLPEWMTETYSVRGTSVSNVDVLFLVILAGLHLIERRWIYVDARTDSES